MVEGLGLVITRHTPGMMKQVIKLWPNSCRVTCDLPFVKQYFFFARLFFEEISLGIGIAAALLALSWLSYNGLTTVGFHLR